MPNRVKQLLTIVSSRFVPDPYAYELRPALKSQDFDFYFTTTANVTYVLNFTDEGLRFGAGHFDCRHYTVDLLVSGAYNPPDKTPPDPRIADTVRAILVRFFEISKNVLITVCDHSDSREAARFRHFRRWFNDSRIDYVERHEFVVNDEDGYSLLSAVYLHINLPHKAKILNRYRQIFTEE